MHLMSALICTTRPNKPVVAVERRNAAKPKTRNMSAANMSFDVHNVCSYMRVACACDGNECNFNFTVCNGLVKLNYSHTHDTRRVYSIGRKTHVHTFAYVRNARTQFLIFPVDISISM